MPHAGTLEWLDSNPKFSEWVENREGAPIVLTVYGQPGSGKSTLGHHLVRHLRERLRNSGSTTRPMVTSYYFDKLDARRRSYKDFLFSILRQLLFQGEHIYQHVETLYKREVQRTQPSKWTHENLWIVVRSIITCEELQKAPFICVVDGLDECDEATRELLSAVSQLHSWTKCDARFAFFTRRGGGQNQGDEQLFAISIDLDEEEGLKRDQILVARQRLSKVPQAMIGSGEGIEMSNTTFLETTLLMDHCAKFPGLVDRSPPYLPAIYDLVMKPLDQSVSTEESFEDHILNLALPWIAYACCPLTIDQLATAIALGSGPKSLSSLEIGREKELLRLTLDSKLGSLLQITEDRICFAHRNIRDIFSEMAFQKSGSEVHADFAEACLSFLCMDEFSNLDPLTLNMDTDPWLNVPNSPPECSEFLRYAVQYWPEHYRNSMDASNSRSDELFNRLEQFFATETRVKWWSAVQPLLEDPLCLNRHVEVNSSTTNVEIEPKWRHLLGVASRLGLAAVVSRLLKDPGRYLGVRGMSVALKVAAEYGWSSVVQAVMDLEDNAPGATASIDDINALKIACAKGHESVVGLLLKRWAKNKQGPTAGIVSRPPPEREESESSTGLGDCLCLASRYGHVHVVQQLLDSGASASYLSSLGSRPHLLAASNGYDLVLCKLLESGADPAATGAGGRTALQLSAINGHLESFRELLGLVAKPVDILTVLHLAATNGRLSIVKELHRRGCNLQGMLSGSTALHAAARNGHSTVVAGLLQAGVDPFPFDRLLKTPLHFATSNNHLQVVKQLLSSGAFPDVGAPGRPPLADAIINGHLRIAETLLKFRATADLPAILRRSTIPLSSITHEFVRSLPQMPLIHLACFFSKPEFVKLLLKYGANPTRLFSVPDMKECAIVHLAYDKPEILELLRGHDINVNCKDSEGWTALYRAVVQSQTASVKVLLAHGADAMIPQSDGFTPLHAAVQNQLESTVQLLINKDLGLVTAIDKFRQTPLFYAARNGDKSLVRLLLQIPDADIYFRDNGGWMPIHWAVLGGGLAFINDTLAEYLQSTDRKKGFQDNERNFLLALAAARGQLEVVNLLLNAGINVNEYDAQYGSALQAATQNGCVNVVERLMEAGANPTLKDLHGWSPILCAERLQGHQLLQLLHKSVGADSIPGLAEGENASADTLPPTAWSDNKSPNISLAEDCRGIRYTWSELRSNLPSGVDPPTIVVRANHPFPARGENPSCYFEIAIIDVGELG